MALKKKKKNRLAKKVHVVCKHCGWEWDTGSKARMVSCPGCNYKTPRKGGGKDEKKT